MKETAGSSNNDTHQHQSVCSTSYHCPAEFFHAPHLVPFFLPFVTVPALTPKPHWQLAVAAGIAIIVIVLSVLSDVPPAVALASIPFFLAAVG